MTCIAGLVEDGKVYIGGDSAGVGGYDLSIQADGKVFENAGFVMGFTTSFRMGQLLRYSFVPPKRHPDTDFYKYMVTDFIDEVRRCFKAGGYAERKDEVELGGNYLVGHNGRLFQIVSDYQVGERSCGFDAVGCGESYALGCMHQIQKKDNAYGSVPQDKIEAALECAEQFSAGVRGPFKVVSV